jgi:hypothetical protein
MKKTWLPVIAWCITALITPAMGQGLLKKLKDKANQAIDRAVGNEVEKKTGLPTGDSNPNNTNNGTGANGRIANKGGAGLSNTEPPDVKLQMTEAVALHTSGKYSDARYALQQAMMGVEIQLGRKILASLPENSVGLPALKDQDKVMSTQWGFSNLLIQRRYSDQKEKEMTVTIGNAVIYSGMAQLYFSNYAMVQANANDQNFKQVKVKGNRAVIQYEDSKGYTLLVPLGQASGIVWECVNFASEQAVISAAESFDIDGIKKLLGEQ